jgi:hypothetical protein
MGGAIISESGGGIIPLRGATSSRNWGAASSGISAFVPKAFQRVVVQTLEVGPTRGLEVALDHAASTAFQISGAVLCLTRSLSSLN